ncbi:hypothetical protein FJT64_025100 [Amphibalanus amphitrite]|uniref:Uncharacterized protein n=1 Tax=Amphibalanus amphitrite TaxID=1232801 RepID=A0A6A4WJJ7_AMPAM|nr:hypothetical protein FJT64_025100 [Amphibalanus amphitrite]
MEPPLKQMRPPLKKMMTPLNVMVLPANESVAPLKMMLPPLKVSPALCRRSPPLCPRRLPPMTAITLAGPAAAARLIAMRAAARRYIDDAPRVGAISETAAPAAKKRASRMPTSRLSGVGTART